jgi:hypothetical protein
MGEAGSTLSVPKLFRDIHLIGRDHGAGNGGHSDSCSRTAPTSLLAGKIVLVETGRNAFSLSAIIVIRYNSY